MCRFSYLFFTDMELYTILKTVPLFVPELGGIKSVYIHIYLRDFSGKSSVKSVYISCITPSLHLSNTGARRR